MLFANRPAGSLVRLLGVFMLLMIVYRHSSWGKNARIGLRGFFPLGVISEVISSVVGVVGPFMAPFSSHMAWVEVRILVQKPWLL